MSRSLPDGIYAVCALNGSAVTDTEAALLANVQGVVEKSGQAGEQLMLIIVDHVPEQGDTGCCSDGEVTLALLGDLDDTPALATELGLPPQTPTCLLALNAFRRWGDNAPRYLPGLWSLLFWNKTSETLTLACSAQVRDPVYVARVGDRVAVSSSLLHLSRMPWMNKQFDTLGMLLSLGRAPVREQLGDGTFLKNVRQLLPGSIERHSKREQISLIWAPPLAFETWSGSAESALQTLESLARCAVRRRLRRHRTVAITLSGGLDSSCLAWLVANERRADQKVIAIASAARRGIGIPDEREWIDLVAKRLGLDVHFAVPDDSTDIYVPSDEWFMGMETPLPTHGHYAHQNIYRIARMIGADAILSGNYGEYSLTRKGALATQENSLLIMLRQTLKKLRRNMPRIGEDDIDRLFHVRLSRLSRARLPPSLARFPVRKEGGDAGNPVGPMGLVPGYEKSLLHSERSPVIGIRDLTPFRDLSLLTFAAGLPAEYTWSGPYSRNLVRRMIEPHLPRQITLRTCKLPFSPEHEHLIRQQAQRRRISIHGMKSQNDWIDLPWLDQALTRIANGKHSLHLGRMGQLTSCTLAFFEWWKRA